MQCIYSEGTVYTAVCSVLAVYLFLNDQVTKVYIQCIYSVDTVYTAVWPVLFMASRRMQVRSRLSKSVQPPMANADNPARPPMGE